MEYDLNDARQILERTPAVLRASVFGLSSVWLDSSEGGESWRVRDVVAHMVGAERQLWIPRLRHILDHGEAQELGPFDRTAEIVSSRGLPVADLVAKFTELRADNLAVLDAMHLTAEQLAKTGRHGDLGRVRVTELLATWAVHDLTHLVQIQRTLASQYADAVGPWRRYLRVVRERAMAERK